MGKLKSTEVYVEIKDAQHLKDLIQICKDYKVDFIEEKYYHRKVYFCYGEGCNAFSDWHAIAFKNYTKVTTQAFIEILNSEQNGR